MSKWLNYHHLLYFQTIAEEGSVSKAAEKLRLGQPTLSAQLKQFEQHLEIDLFERKHKRLILTEQGKMALDYARQIFKMGNEMLEVLQDNIQTTKVHLQIGALDSIPKHIIMELTKAAYKINPCTVSLVEGKFEELLRELVAHKIDLFVTNSLPTISDLKDLNYRSVVKTPVYIYGSKKFKHLKKNFPTSIKHQPFILPTFHSKLRSDLEHWFKTNQIHVNVIAETQDVSLKKMMATEGLGLIPAASHNVNQHINPSNLIKIGRVHSINEELFLITASRKITNPLALELMKKFII